MRIAEGPKESFSDRLMQFNGRKSQVRFKAKQLFKKLISKNNNTVIYKTGKKTNWNLYFLSLAGLILGKKPNA
jgi:hypothetical protein